MTDLYADPQDNNERNPLRDVVKNLEAELKNARSTIAAFEKEKRSATLADLVAAKGLPAKVANLIPADADPEKWIEENGDLFAAPTTAPSTEAPAPTAPAEPVVDAEAAEKAAADAALANDWSALRKTEATATPAAPPTTGDAALEALLKAAESGGTAGITNLMRSLGANVG